MISSLAQLEENHFQIRKQTIYGKNDYLGRLKFIGGHRGQNSGGSRLVAGLESAVTARINRCN